MPLPTAMSTPACRRPQRIPKGETTGPFTGQTSRSAALPDRAAGDALRGERGLHARLLGLERAQVALERNAAVAHRGERAALVCPRRGELVARGDELALGGGDLVALRQDPLGGELLLLLELGELDGLVVGLVAQVAHPVGDLAVLLGDALEELGPLEQVAEPVRLEDDGQGVRAVRLVDLDEPGGQHAAGGVELAAQPLEPVARLLELVAHRLEQLGLLAVEARLGALEAALGGEISPWSASMRLLNCWMVVESTPSFCLACSISLALLLDALRERRGQAGQRKHEVGR